MKEKKIEEMAKEGLKNEESKNAQVLKLNGELEVLIEKHAKEVLGVRNDNEKTEINVCALQIKIKQLTEEQADFMYSRRNFENQLSAQTSKLEQAEHDLKRSTRKFEFTQDELDQLKLQFDKERAKFETATRDSIQLQDQVSFLLSESDSLKIQLQEAESKTSKSLSKSDRMKEKVKIYQKNLSEAHGEEMEGLYETVKSLTEKLKRKEMELRLNKSGSEKVGRVKVSKNVDFGSVKSVENVKNVETESEIAEKPEITLKNSVKPEKTLETNLETLPKPQKCVGQNLEELNKKLKKLEKEKLDLQDELNETLRGRSRVSDVSEKRKRVDSVEIASDENKENIDPNAKKSKTGKKQRVVLGEKTNAQVPVKRSTRDRKKTGAVNKTMY
jgi:chromosome segregation ATPase